MMTESRKEEMDREFFDSVDIPNDHGHMIRVSGEIVAEDMHFNDKTGMLTVEKLYAAGEGRLAYAAISAVDDRRDRRAYIIEERGDKCHASNGSITLELGTADLIELLSLALQEESKAETSRSSLEHIRSRLAVNA